MIIHPFVILPLAPQKILSDVEAIIFVKSKLNHIVELHIHTGMGPSKILAQPFLSMREGERQKIEEAQVKEGLKMKNQPS